MLNGTLHGEKSTQSLLQSTPEPGGQYVLRPIGNWVFNRGWYLKDIILALHSMGLGLARFCIQDSNDRINLTSKFAMVKLVPEAKGEIFRDHFTEVDSLAAQLGLSEVTRESLIVQLAEGHRLIRLKEGHRRIVLEFGPGSRLLELRQEFTSEFEDVDWSALMAM